MWLKIMTGGLVTLMVLLLGPLWVAADTRLNSEGASSWRTADRSSAGLAPDPVETPEAVVQVYAARAWSWRGYFAVHTWISTKAEGASHYRVHQVVGWRRPIVQSQVQTPDRAWYGQPPTLLADLRGPQATEAIAQIEQAVIDYPYPDQYRAWPGPNSNTFVAWLIRQADALNVALPNHAIGKDYLGMHVAAVPPGGAGLQVSLGGIAGVLLGWREGFEMNILGLSFGVNPMAMGIKLPGIGEWALRNTNPMPPGEDEG